MCMCVYVCVQVLLIGSIFANKIIECQKLKTKSSSRCTSTNFRLKFGFLFLRTKRTSSAVATLRAWLVVS